MDCRKWFLVVLTTSGSLLLGTIGTAGETWHRWCQDFHRMASWPEPFQQADRAATLAPFAAMVDKGWQLEHTLSTAQFGSSSADLTIPGQRRLARIVAVAPAHRRAVFIQRAADDRLTQARVEAVRDQLQRLGARSAEFAVLPTDGEVPLADGDRVEQLNKRLRESVPEPKLPPAASNSYVPFWAAPK